MILTELVDLVLALCHSPMALLLQRIPVSQCCYSTSLRSNPYAQGPEGARDEEQHQVTAIEETATFVVAVLGSISE